MTTPTSYGAAELDSHEVYAGAVLWLPPLDDVKRHRLERYQRDEKGGVRQRGIFGGANDINPRFFNHPIVVLSRPLPNVGIGSGGVIDFVPMTTFSRHPDGIASLWNVEDQKRHLPIEPAAPHPVFDFRLQYKYGLVSDRGSNICLKTIYKMQWRDAQRFYDGHGVASREPWALTEESMERLMNGLREYTKDSANGAVYEAGKQYCFSKMEVKMLKRQVRRREWAYCWERTRGFAWLWSMVLLRAAWPLLVVLLRAAYLQELVIGVYLLAFFACGCLGGLECCLFWAFYWVRWARRYAFQGLTMAVRKGDEVLHHVCC